MISEVAWPRTCSVIVAELCLVPVITTPAPAHAGSRCINCSAAPPAPGCGPDEAFGATPADRPHQLYRTPARTGRREATDWRSPPC